MPDPGRQATLAARTRTMRGPGLHSGEPSSVALLPAQAGAGIVFRRTDLPGSPDIPATHASLVAAPRCTALGRGGAEVRVVEHVLAACVFTGIDNAVIEVGGSEVPSGDGSAAAFMELILDAGLSGQDAPRRALAPAGPVEITGGTGAGWSFRIEPADAPSYSFRFRGGGELDGKEAAFTPGRDDPRLVAPARTFCFEAEIKALLAQGLGKGGNIDSVLVLSSEGAPLNAMRVPLEPVRHKLVDLIGDMALAGVTLMARIAAEGTGHAAHAEILRRLAPGLIQKGGQ